MKKSSKDFKSFASTYSAIPAKLAAAAPQIRSQAVKHLFASGDHLTTLGSYRVH